MIKTGDELITLVEIEQPQCTRIYGIAPCTAVLGTTGPRKCYNTRKTCQDPAHYLTAPLTLRFGSPQLDLLQYGYVIPALRSVRTTPQTINLAAMQSSASPFGQREVVTIELEDFLHSDVLVDKYRLQRLAGTAGTPAFDPYLRGTFWGKWIARNPYHEGIILRVRYGKLGQALADMETRTYYVDKIDGPHNGSVTITAKDLFTLVEGRKAVAPRASRGELLADISAVDGAATLTPTGIGNLEYPASGYIAIGKEEIAFTRAGDVLTLTTRGANSTPAQAHKAEDKVQLVLVYAAQSPQNIVSDLLTTYGGISSSAIPIAEWNAETAAQFPYVYSAHIAAPTPINALIGELAEQVGFAIWPNVTTALINMRAIVPRPATTIIDDNTAIVSGSVTLRRQNDIRVSEVWIYYGQVNPLEKLNEHTNYRSRLIVADLLAEGLDQYGSASIKVIYSRWISAFARAAATNVGNRVLSILRDPPISAQFRLSERSAQALQLVTPFVLRAREIQDATGAAADATLLPVRLARSEGSVDVFAQQLRFYVAPDSPALGEHRIYIDNDTRDINLRTLHDALFLPAISGDVVRVYIAAGVVVGSTTTGPALETGNWPAGVTLIIENRGRIAGKGGRGGTPGTYSTTRDGTPGGLAFRATYPVKVYNLAGVGIFAGGGGGGAGGSYLLLYVQLFGGPGGGGAGDAPGLAGTYSPPQYATFSPGSPGADGTSTGGGLGGLGQAYLATSGGAGGAGGAPAQAGTNGSPASASFAFALSPPGAGAAAGAAIAGITYIAWIDANGNPTTGTGIIVGAIS